MFCEDGFNSFEMEKSMQEENVKYRGQRRPERTIDLSLLNIWLTEVTDPGVSPSLL